MITSPTLTLAQEALVAAATQRQQLQVQNNAQARKITELEREIQRLSTILSQTQVKLSDAQQEVSNLRALLPDAATEKAFAELSQYLSASSETPAELRIAA